MDGSIWKYVEYEYEGTSPYPSCKIEYDRNKQLESKREYEYDADGKTLRRDQYKVDDSGNYALSYYLISEYDAAGKLYKESNYSADGSLKNYTIYEYDSAGNEVGWKEYNSDGKLLYQLENGSSIVD